MSFLLCSGGWIYDWSKDKESHPIAVWGRKTKLGRRDISMVVKPSTLFWRHQFRLRTQYHSFLLLWISSCSRHRSPERTSIDEIARLPACSVWICGRFCVCMHTFIFPFSFSHGGVCICKIGNFARREWMSEYTGGGGGGVDIMWDYLSVIMPSRPRADQLPIFWVLDCRFWALVTRCWRLSSRVRIALGKGIGNFGDRNGQRAARK